MGSIESWVHDNKGVILLDFDIEVLEWVDDNWHEDYDTEFDWYTDNGTGEAEANVLKEYFNKFMPNITVKQLAAIFNKHIPEINWNG